MPWCGRSTSGRGVSICHATRDDSSRLTLGDWRGRPTALGASSRTDIDPPAFAPARTHRVVPWRSLGSALLILSGACRVESLPPSSSRTDGGPVFARGVISHEARSQVRIYRDAAGCESIQTTNRQFRVVTVQDDEGPRRLVLEETYDVRYCVESESVGSEAVITAWQPDSGQTAPLFRIAGRGVSGSPVGNLYRMSSHGCCGSQELDTYWSLLTGRSLFASSIGLRELTYPGGRRYAAFHDTFSAAAPPEAARDSSVIGVLELGDDRGPAARVAVATDHPEPFAVERLAFARGRTVLPDTSLAVSDSAARDLRIRVELTAPSSGRRLAFAVPIVNGRLSTEGVRLPAGFRLESGR